MKKFAYVFGLVSLLSLTACDGGDVPFVAPELKEVDIHTKLQDDFWADTDVESSLLSYGMGEEDLDKPNPITITWKPKRASTYNINVSEKEDMSEAWTFTSKKQKFDLYNCKTGTKYYCQISASSFTSEVFTFTTKSGGPRNLYVDGINNIRDIGGYLTNDGKTVNQGLIYRSAKMNESSVSKPKITITKTGIGTMKNQLGVKTDIDLRKTEIADGVSEIGGITSSPLGEDVKYINCPMYYEGSAVIGHVSSAKDKVNKQSIKEMFNVLGDRNNYPVVFHCTQGKDRTGALAYLMETLLGMKTDDIYHDYLFTNLSKIGGYCAYKAFSGYDYYLNKQSGDNLQEKAFSYLLSIGVEEQTINNFLNIMLS